MRHLTLLGFLLVASCAGQAGDVCDTICECSGCNDREEDLCIISVNEEQDRAAAYDCAQEYADYLECFLTTAECQEGQVIEGEECYDDFNDYLECVSDNSDLF